MRLSGARRLRRVAACATILVVAAGCGGQMTASSEDPVSPSAVRVTAFSSAQPGWDSVIPAFTSADSGREVKSEFGASGDITKKIQSGEPADIAHLGDSRDMAALVEAELVPPNWNNGSTGGYPVSSVVSMVVRAGNPRGIDDWSDLLQPGLEVVTPNPVVVGSGRWALLAAYAYASDGNRDFEAGQTYMRRLILEHIALGPSTVKQASDEFVSGRGDVLLISEAAALQMVRQGQPVEQVIPAQTIRMDFPLAVTNTGLEKPSATDLVEFVFSPRGQELWAQAGMRPSGEVPGVQFPTPEKLWTIDDLGGWDAVGPRFFGPEGFITGLFEMATQ